MSKAIAMTSSTVRSHSAELTRAVIVLACGAALIFAGQPAPFPL